MRHSPAPPCSAAQHPSRSASLPQAKNTNERERECVCVRCHSLTDKGTQWEAAAAKRNERTMEAQGGQLPAAPLSGQCLDPPVSHLLQACITAHSHVTARFFLSSKEERTASQRGIAQCKCRVVRTLPQPCAASACSPASEMRGISAPHQQGRASKKCAQEGRLRVGQGGGRQGREKGKGKEKVKSWERRRAVERKMEKKVKEREGRRAEGDQ